LKTKPNRIRSCPICGTIVGKEVSKQFSKRKEDNSISVCLNCTAKKCNGDCEMRKKGSVDNA